MSHLIYQLEIDIALYKAQLEAFDKAIASPAFAQLPEDQQASRLRSRSYLAGYLQDALEDLQAFGVSANG
jgi:hypothetical protein